MRSIHLFAAGLAILAVAACATSTPGWTYAPASPTPVPSADTSGSAPPSASADPGATPSGDTASPAGSASTAPSGAASPPPSASAPAAVVELAAQNIAFDKTELSVAADEAFQIVFANNDPGVPHNVEIKDAAGGRILNGEIFSGIATKTYDVQPLQGGAYQFVCSVHLNMVGTLTAQ